MKKNLLFPASLISIAALIILIISLVNPKAANKKENDEQDLNTPNDLFYLQRSFPDSYFNVHAYTNAIQQVKDEMSSASRSSEFNAQWTSEGPQNIGGRFNVMAVNPVNPNIIYAGSANGGVFKTTDAGASWLPIFDAQPYLAIGVIVFEPGNPNTIYVGTGDPNISGMPYIGDGIYKSNDAGATWIHLGLANARIISKIIINPVNTNIIYAGTMGIPFYRDNNRGLYKSTDGGATWNNILFLSTDAGIIDLLMNPTNPQVLYAAGWNRIRNNHEGWTYGSAAKIYKTINGGASWNMLTNGLPQDPQSRISMSMSGTNPNLIYALYADTTHNIQGLYKTTDAGNTWDTVATSYVDPSPLNGQGWYSGGIRVNPVNDSEIYLCGVDLYKSVNGGLYFDYATPGWASYIVHADLHDVQFHGSSVYVCTDGGLYRTDDGGTTWSDIDNIANNQFYHITTDPNNAGFYAGGVQDNGTTEGNASVINSWSRLFGGDGFSIQFDPGDPMTYYCETQNGSIYQTNDGGGSFNEITQGLPTEPRNWDMPYLISPQNPFVIYLATNKVYRYDGALTALSPDLTDGGQEARFHNVSTLTQSSVNSNFLFAGTADGRVWRSLDEGNTWTNLTDTTVLPYRYVTAIRTSPDDSNVVYVTHSGYKENDSIAHIHKSINKGTSWINISGDIPPVAVNDILPVPGRDSILFVATDGGVYCTLNYGAHWSRIGSNMPVCPVFDVEFDYVNNKLLAGTFARSLMSYPLDSVFGRIATPTIFLSDDLELSAYPNPCTDIIYVTTSNAVTSLSVYNSSGVRVKYISISNKTKTVIDISTLASGIYLITAETPIGRQVRKIVKI